MPRLVEHLQFNTKEHDALEISNVIDKVRALIPPRKLRIEKNMIIGGDAKWIDVYIPDDLGPRLELLHFTDFQYGNPQCNVEKAKEYVAWTASEPNRLVLCGGDLVDSATMLQKHSGAMEQQIQPDDQAREVAEILAPIADRIVGNVGGNHEAHGARVGHNFGAQIAEYLGIPYSRGVQHINIYYKDWKPFKVYLWHGRGGARTKGAKAQMMWSVIPNDKANLYISGHIHDALILPGVHIDRDKGNKLMSMEKFYAVSSTSFLNYYGTYAETGFYPPNFTLMGVAMIYPNGTFRISI